MLVLPVLLLAWAAWQRRWVADDGFINLRVVDQVLAGHGPVFNAGERVEAATSPLWMGLLVVFRLPLLWMPLAWEAVVLGIAATLGGLATATLGARALWRALGSAQDVRWWIPAGALAYASLPPAWDFASSGLETGLSLLWLGSSAWAGAAAVARGRDRGCPWYLPVLVGLGPLIRPDLVVVSAALAALPLLLAWQGAGMRWRGLARVALLGVALPATWQVFRMGYYGALLPNTVYAKEGSRAWWSQGWRYLVDFQRPYLWGLPLVGLLLVGLVLVVQQRAQVTPAWALAAGAPVLGGFLHALLVVRAGGDFMHGRLLLPGLFACLWPVMALPRRAAGHLGVLVLAWSAVVVPWGRPAYPGFGPHGIADERSVYVGYAGTPHPVTLEDYGRDAATQAGFALRRATEAGDRVLYVNGTDLLARTGGLPLRPDEHWRGAAFLAPNVGIIAYASGPDSVLIDTLGLGDLVGARTELPAQRGRPGHEKYLDGSWVVGRLVPAGIPLPATVDAGGIDAARQALACAPLRQLLEAARAPLTPGRFVANMGSALRHQGSRVPADPRAAAAACTP